MSENDEKYTIFHYLSFINCNNIASVRKTLSLQLKILVMKADLIKYISKINEKPSVQGKLLEQFISHGASTIPEMSKAIGVSLPTTTSALNELIKEGLAREIGKKDNSSGRIPMVYDLVPTAGYFIGVNPEMNCLALAASDFAGNLITEKQECLTYMRTLLKTWKK